MEKKTYTKPAAKTVHLPELLDVDVNVNGESKGTYDSTYEIDTKGGGVFWDDEEFDDEEDE